MLILPMRMLAMASLKIPKCGLQSLLVHKALSRQGNKCLNMPFIWTVPLIESLCWHFIALNRSKEDHKPSLKWTVTIMVQVAVYSICINFVNESMLAPFWLKHNTLDSLQWLCFGSKTTQLQVFHCVFVPRVNVSGGLACQSLPRFC